MRQQIFSPRTRRVSLLVIPVFALAMLMAVMSGFQRPAFAEAHSCRSVPSCPNNSTCSGTYFSLSGCTVQCYNDANGNVPGQIVPSGSARCDSGTGGTGGGGGGGGTGGGGGGFGQLAGYCSDNWMWDAGCSGPGGDYSPIGWGY